MSGIDEYYDRLAPTSRTRVEAERARQQAQADREGVDVEAVRFREREAQKAAEAAASRERDALAAQALASVTLVQPPEGTHPSNRKVYTELNRQRQAAAIAQAEAEFRDPTRLRQLASDRQAVWEDAYKKEHGHWPTISEMDQAGVLAPWLREKWARDDAARAADRQR